MNINVVENRIPSEKAQGCLSSLLFFCSLVAAVLAIIPFKGFWFCLGIFCTVFIGGFFFGAIGLNIGNSILKFVKPDFFATDGSIGTIIRTKIFWMIGPPLVSMTLCWIVGIHLLLMLFWGIPITILGKDVYVVKKEAEPLSKKIKNAKNNLSFINKMAGADMATKRNAMIMVGIDAGSLVTVQKMIAEGADINAPRIPLNAEGMPYKDQTPISPLFAALSFAFDRSEIALFLIQSGADVNERNDRFKGPTPLLFVLRNNMLHLVEPLLNRKANVNVTDVDGKTPLHYAVSLKLDCSIKKMIEMGASVSIKDRWGNTPLDYADSSEKVIIEFLVKEREKKQKERDKNV